MGVVSNTEVKRSRAAAVAEQINKKLKLTQERFLDTALASPQPAAKGKVFEKKTLNTALIKCANITDYNPIFLYFSSRRLALVTPPDLKNRVV